LIFHANQDGALLEKQATMYETALAERSYASPTRSTATPRGIEYQAFARITRDLAAADSGASPTIGPLAKALVENLNLWTILGIDVAHPKNGLPAELRSKLFYLFEFTRHHTAKVLQGEATARVLIDVNTAVMRGLRPATPREGHA
jgi:flagellar protein FlaF